MQSYSECLTNETDHEQYFFRHHLMTVMNFMNLSGIHTGVTINFDSQNAQWVFTLKEVN